MSNPAPPDDGAAPSDDGSVYRPTWQDLWLHCLAERDRHDILQTNAAHDPSPTARRVVVSHARQVAIYEALRRLVERCQGSPGIVAELKRIEAAQAAEAGDGDADGESGI